VTLIGRRRRSRDESLRNVISALYTTAATTQFRLSISQSITA